MSEIIDRAKPGIIAEHRLHDTDTGSPEVQIALLTAAHQPPQRAPEGPQEGPPQPSGPADAGRPASAPARLRPQQRRRALPGDHRHARPAPLAEALGSGPRAARIAYWYTTEPGGVTVSCQSPSPRSDAAGGLPTGNWPRRPNRCAERPGKESDRWLTPSPSPVPISGTDKTLTFETGKLAPQSPGRRRRHASATPWPWSPPTPSKSVREGIDFFPLTVDVEEKHVRRRARSPARSSAGRAGPPTRPSSPAGSSTGRCARASPTATATRPRSSCTVIGADQENPHDVLAINGASAALMLSGLPFDGPIGAVRLAYSQRRHAGSPTPPTRRATTSTFEIVVAGRRSTTATSPS